MEWGVSYVCNNNENWFNIKFMIFQERRHEYDLWFLWWTKLAFPKRYLHLVRFKQNEIPWGKIKYFLF